MKKNAVLAGLLLAIVAYCLLFYLRPILPGTVAAEGVSRIEYQLTWLFRPDYLILSWVGGAPDRFGILDRIPILLAGSWILLAALAAGWLSLLAVGIERGLTRLESAVFSIGVGLNLWSLLVLAVGLAGGLHWKWLLVTSQLLTVVVAGAVWHGRGIRQAGSDSHCEPADQRERTEADRAVARSWPAALPRFFRDVFSNERSDQRERTEADRAAARSWPAALPPLPPWPLWGLIPFTVVILLGAMLPPWHFDVRGYHLQVPKEWFQQGYVSFMPHNIYGNMPLGAQMHAILGSALMWGPRDWWWGALVGKTIIASFAPLAALALYAAGKRFVSPAAGVVAALVYISTPWVANVSMAGLIEGAVAFYLLLGVYAVMLWRQAGTEHGSIEQAGGVTGTSYTSDSSGDQEGRPTTADSSIPQCRRGYVLLAGFAAGAAVACKYPSLLFVAFPLGVWVLASGWRVNLRAAVLFTAAALAACGLWLGKNQVLAGNPTYPLLGELFGGRTLTEEKKQQWREAHAVPRDPAAGEGAWFPRHTHRQFAAEVRRLFLDSERLSALIWPLVALALFSRQYRRQVIWLGLFALFFFLSWWLATHRLDRFWMPMLVLLAWISGIGANWFMTTRRRPLLMILVVVLLGANLHLISTRAMGDNRFFVALEDLRLDLPRNEDPGYTRVNSARRWLNHHVLPGHAVLMIGDAQVFDLEVPVYYSTCFDTEVLEAFFKGKSRSERQETLQRHRISHVLVDWVEIERYRSPANYGYSDYFTRELFRDELVEQQRLLDEVILPLNPDEVQIFEVRP